MVYSSSFEFLCLTWSIVQARNNRENDDSDSDKSSSEDESGSEEEKDAKTKLKGKELNDDDNDEDDDDEKEDIVSSLIQPTFNTEPNLANDWKQW